MADNPAERDDYRLERIASDHAVCQDSFIQCAIIRLAPDSDATESSMSVQLTDIDTAGERERSLRVHWSSETRPSVPPALQRRRVTEDAAYGVAFVVVKRYAELKAVNVAEDGDRFDFWVTDDKHDYGLEVSGTTTTRIASRHRLKVSQLLDNPYEVDGYVVVVGFAKYRVLFSFHRVEEQSGEPDSP